MVTTTDPTLFTPPPPHNTSPPPSHLSAARLYLNIPRQESNLHSTGVTTGITATTSSSSSQMNLNRLRSMSNADNSSLRSYPSSMNGGGIDSSGLPQDDQSPSSTTSGHNEGGVESSGKPRQSLHQWEMTLANGAFPPSPLPSPAGGSHPGGHHPGSEFMISSPSSSGNVISRNSGGGGGVSPISPTGDDNTPKSKTSAFFSSSFKAALPTPSSTSSRPFGSSTISTTSCPSLAEVAAEGITSGSGSGFGSPTRPSPPTSSFQDTQPFNNSNSAIRRLAEPTRSSTLGIGLPSEESSLGRARSLGEASRARARIRGSTLEGRSNAFFNTSYATLPPSPTSGPNTTGTNTPAYFPISSPQSITGSLNTSNRSVSTPFSLKMDMVTPNPTSSLPTPIHSANASGISLNLEPRKFVRETSTNRIPTTASSKALNQELHAVEIIQEGTVLIPEPSTEESEKEGPLNGAVSQEDKDSRAWKVLKILGQGAFSVVWTGYAVEKRNGGGGGMDVEWQRLPDAKSVAIKVMDKRMCRENDRTRISFVREVEVLKRISHPQVVAYQTSFSTCSYHCLVLEQIAGGELFDLLQTSGNQAKMGEDFLRRVFCELARGVGWLNDVGIVHRDLKLENIMFTVDPFKILGPNGKIAVDQLPSPLLKITDFGLARFIDPAKPLLETRCGSESFAAPEIIMGRPYDGRETDSWACGVILYALLTGELPFDRSVGGVAISDSESEAERRKRMMRIAKGQYEWPTGKGSEGARNVVARLLQRDPKRRTRVGKALWEEIWMNGPGSIPAPSYPKDVLERGTASGAAMEGVLIGEAL